MKMPDNFEQYLHQIHLNLPDMVFGFDDIAMSNSTLLPEDYLQYYGIDFHRQLADIHYRIGKLDIDGFRIVCQYWTPQSEVKGTVLVLHGYFDHVGLFGHLIRHLLEKRYAVVTFDLPGHGLSSGEKVSIESFARYVMVLDGVMGQLDGVAGPVHAVGQSTGGAIMLKALLSFGSIAGIRYAERLDKIVLLAPLVKPAKWVTTRLLYKSLNKFKDSVKRRYVETCSNPEFLEFIANHDPLQSRHVSVAWVGAMKQWIDLFPSFMPLQREISIVQGDNDHTVDWQHNTLAIAQKFSRVSLAVVPGAGHHLVNESETLRGKVFEAMPL